MEEKKNQKGLVWLIVILIVLVLGLIGYIVYDKVLKVDKTISNNDETTTTITTTTTNKIVDEESAKEEIILYNQDDIVIMLKDSKDNEFLESHGHGYYKFFFNNKELKELEIEDYGIDVKCNKFDNNYIFVEHYNGIIYNYYILGMEGNIVLDFSKYSSLNSAKGFYELKFSNNKFNIITTIDFGKYYGYHELGVYKDLCTNYKDDSIAEMHKEFEYLGNGKLGEEKIVSQKTLQEYLKDKGYSNCQEVINS